MLGLQSGPSWTRPTREIFLEPKKQLLNPQIMDEGGTKCPTGIFGIIIINIIIINSVLFVAGWLSKADAPRGTMVRFDEKCLKTLAGKVE